MRVVVIGASGTIGKEVAAALQERHEVVRASRSSGDFRVDITNPESVKALFEAVGPVEAVVCVAGGGAWKPLSELTDADFAFSLSYKLMGQVNLVRYGAGTVSGSFTLTTGVLAQSPMPGSAAISLINAGVEGFARAAALELQEKGVRVDVISPPWVSETLEAMGQNGAHGQPAVDVARAYVRAVEDATLNGHVIDSRSVS